MTQRLKFLNILVAHKLVILSIVQSLKPVKHNREQGTCADHYCALCGSRHPLPRLLQYSEVRHVREHQKLQNELRQNLLLPPPQHFQT